MKIKNPLKKLYIDATRFLFPELPNDFKYMGKNKQGFSIYGSEKECCSFEFIIIDFKIN
jgi:hypothetical protein